MRAGTGWDLVPSGDCETFWLQSAVFLSVEQLDLYSSEQGVSYQRVGYNVTIESLSSGLRVSRAGQLPAGVPVLQSSNGSVATITVS